MNFENTDVFENVLHLDCCFQPIGERKAIICPDSFVDKSDVVVEEPILIEHPTIVVEPEREAAPPVELNVSKGDW